MIKDKRVMIYVKSNNTYHFRKTKDYNITIKLIVINYLY